MQSSQTFIDLNYDENRDLAKSYGVRFVPSVVIEEPNKSPIVFYGKAIIDNLKPLLNENKN